mgnify:CR=1 FL=1
MGGYATAPRLLATGGQITVDTLFLRQLQIRCCIGVYAWEQHSLRPLTVDVALHGNFSAAAASDQLADTVDYFQLAEQIHALAASRPFALIEHLAGSICTLALADARIHSCEVTIHKRGAVAAAEARPRGDRSRLFGAETSPIAAQATGKIPLILRRDYPQAGRRCAASHGAASSR